MESATATLVKAEGLPQNERDYYKRQICDLLGVDFDQLVRQVRQSCQETDRYRQECERLTRRCDTLEAMQRLLCCPGQLLYSPLSIDEGSNQNQIDLEAIEQGLGEPYVDTWPLPPQKKIRLQTLARPGFMPEKIAIDLAFANNGDNYLDLRIQFFLTPGGNSRMGKPYGPRYRGNQFLNKDGSQIHIPFPPYRDRPLTIGTLERLAVEIEHTGPNNLNSAYVTVYHDAQRFYQLCRESCDASTCG